MYDVIVVGARCAGSPTAMLLSRLGHRVLLVDKGTFPSAKLSTHIVHVPGIARLSAWGVLDRVVASGCPPLAGAVLDLGAFSLSAQWPSTEQSPAYCPKREVLDKILVDEAVASGSEFRDHFAVDQVLFDAGHVVGVRGRDRDGRDVVEHAQLVIGADGLHSRVADAVAAPRYEERATLTCVYYAYFEGVEADSLEIHLRPGHVIAAIPTNDHQTVVYAGWRHQDFPRVKSDLDASYLGAIALAPSLDRRVRAGRRASRIMGTGDLPNFFRKPYGSGWALVGDAGYHRDPILAHGMSDAFRDAELVAEAAHASLSGERPAADAFADYEERRNRAAMPIYRLTTELATLDPPTDLIPLLAALQNNGEQRQRFMGMIAGVVPVAEFLAPQNVQRILDSAEPSR